MNCQNGRPLVLALFVLGCVRSAQAAEQHLVYDLSVEGSPVGTREVTVRYFTRPSGERHVVESYTHIVAPGLTLESRGSGLSTPGGAQFSSATDQNGARSSVAAQELPGGGWQLTVVGGGKESDRTEPDARLSTFDLMDPARVATLEAGGTFGVVLAETGDVLTGTLETGKPGTVTVGGQPVPVSTYTLTGSAGTARFYVTGDGLLVRSEVQWLGLTMLGSLHELPAARDYGTVETVDGLSGGVKEGDL